MRRRNIHEKFKLLCQLFAYGSERPIAGGRRLDRGGGDAAVADIGRVSSLTTTCHVPDARLTTRIALGGNN